jgi:hypothetical protein
MTMIIHARDHQLLRGYGVRTADASRGASHLAMIKRFAKFTLSIALIAIVVTAVMAIRVVAWFPPFHH